VQASVSEPADVQRLFAKTKKAFGKLDLLVNNAGVFKFEPFEAISIAEFHREFWTNVLGPILTIQEAIRQFGFEGGRVINISSLAGSHSLPNGVVYSATKAALENLTRAWRRNSDRAGSASMRSRRATPAAKARRPRAFSVKKASSNTSPLHHSGAWVSLRILPACRLSRIGRILMGHRRNDSSRRRCPLKSRTNTGGILLVIPS
jgi:NAD(P)-dependent dehydrogenase (short-subunit alcohol dehydrogenase family)